MAALTNPTSTIEVGAGYVSQDSFKFGQYNGLFDKGVYGIFNIDVRGGAPYDSDSAQRWRIYGTNLGLDDRYLYGEFGEQGTYRIWGSFDQLRSNYATRRFVPDAVPGRGIQPSDAADELGQAGRAAGRTRPAAISARSRPTTGLANSHRERRRRRRRPRRSRRPSTTSSRTMCPDFQNVDLDTTRKTYAGGFSVNLGPRWVFTASASQTQQDGLKPLSSVTSSSRTSGRRSCPTSSTTPRTSTTRAITYTGQEYFLTAAYYGSFFTNDVKSMTWENCQRSGHLCVDEQRARATTSTSSS